MLNVLVHLLVLVLIIFGMYFTMFVIYLHQIDKSIIMYSIKCLSKCYLIELIHVSCSSIFWKHFLTAVNGYGAHAYVIVKPILKAKTVAIKDHVVSGK